jgi:AmmeMemoRadiSam system protein A
MEIEDDRPAGEAGEHPLVQLARSAVEHYVLARSIVEPPVPLIAEMAGRAGVFVSIKKRRELRGCIGTLEPTQDTIAEELIQNAISSATRDPRFPPVTSDELPSLSYSVDVLGEPEPVRSLAELDPCRYGVIVVSGGRRGLLLPDLEGVDTVEQQLEIARAKAGILPGESVEVFRFEVRRFR